MPKAFIFDLDGTLIDSVADIGNALNRVLTEFGYESFPVAYYKTLVGEGARQLIADTLKALHVDAADALITRVLARYKEVYRDNLIVETKLYDGMPETLSWLEAQNIPLAILTNKPEALTHTMCETLLSKWHFTYAYGDKEGEKKKPDPIRALQIAEGLGIACQDIAFVGDTKVDMQTATAAAMQAWGVLWGFRGRQELLDHGAQHLFETPRDFLSHCQNLRVAS